MSKHTTAADKALAALKTVAEAAIQEAHAAQANLKEFTRENADILGEYLTLVSAAETKYLAAKTALQGLPGDSGFEYRNFKKSKSSGTQTIRVEALPVRLFTLSGVVKAVDIPHLVKLAAQESVLTEAEKAIVKGALSTVPKAASVTPPTNLISDSASFSAKIEATLKA